MSRELVEELAPEIGGLSEAAAILGWTRGRLASERTKASRGQGGHQGMPSPIATANVAATPLFWLPEWRFYAEVMKTRGQ